MANVRGYNDNFLVDEDDYTLEGEDEGSLYQPIPGYMPFQDLPRDTFRDICQQMDVQTLSTWTKTSKEYLNICSDILRDKIIIERRRLERRRKLRLKNIILSRLAQAQDMGSDRFVDLSRMTPTGAGIRTVSYNRNTYRQAPVGRVILLPDHNIAVGAQQYDEIIDILNTQ